MVEQGRPPFARHLLFLSSCVRTETSSEPSHTHVAYVFFFPQSHEHQRGHVHLLNLQTLQEPIRGRGGGIGSVGSLRARRTGPKRGKRKRRRTGGTGEAREEEEGGSFDAEMENMLGLLKVRVVRGMNLAVRDVVTSDPYLVIKMGKQKLKTHVVKKNVNPEWNEDLTLSIIDPTLPIKFVVYDKDTFSLDDKMGHAEFDIQPFLEAVKMRLECVPNNTVIKKVTPSRTNCLAEESKIYFCDGKVVQDVILRLKDVECGEVELQMHWIDVPNSKGL